VVASIYDDTALEARFTLTNAQYGRMATDADPLLGRKVEFSWSVGGAEYVWPATSTGSARGWPPSAVGSRCSPASASRQPGAVAPWRLCALTVPDRIWRATFRLPETAIRSSDHVFCGGRWQA
jgi:hypothetical protein